MTSADIQRKIAIGTGKKRKVPPEEKLSVEKVADRFNQVNRSKLSSYFWALHFVFHFQVYIGILRFLVLWRAKYQTTRKKKMGTNNKLNPCYTESHTQATAMETSALNFAPSFPLSPSPEQLGDYLLSFFFVYKPTLIINVI